MSTASVPVGAAALVRRRPPPAVRRQRFLVAVANHSLLIAAAIMFLAPFAFIVLTALMTNDQALSSHLWPHPFRWRNFSDVFHQAPLLRWTLNTMIYSVVATIGVVVSSVPVAYALARLRWRGRNLAFMVVLIALMLPPQVTVVPLYVMWSKLHPFGFHFIGTLWPLIIPNWLGDAFSIFLLRQFFLTIPEEYLDAARVDGCGELRILTTVVLRMAKPAIAAVALEHPAGEPADDLEPLRVDVVERELRDAEPLPLAREPGHELGRVRRAGADDRDPHPLTPVSVTPSMKARWARKKRTIAGAITSRVAAIVRFHCTCRSERNSERPIESTQWLGFSPTYRSGRKKSLKV